MKNLSVLSLFLTLSAFVTTSVFAQSWNCIPKGGRSPVDYLVTLKSKPKKVATIESINIRTKEKKDLKIDIPYKKFGSIFFNHIIGTDPDQSFVMVFGKKDYNSGEGSILSNAKYIEVTCFLEKK